MPRQIPAVSCYVTGQQPFLLGGNESERVLVRLGDWEPTTSTIYNSRHELTNPMSSHNVDMSLMTVL